VASLPWPLRNAIPGVGHSPGSCHKQTRPWQLRRHGSIVDNTYQRRTDSFGRLWGSGGQPRREHARTTRPRGRTGTFAQRALRGVRAGGAAGVLRGWQRSPGSILPSYALCCCAARFCRLAAAGRAWRPRQAPTYPPHVAGLQTWRPRARGPSRSCTARRARASRNGHRPR